MPLHEKGALALTDRTKRASRPAGRQAGRRAGRQLAPYYGILCHTMAYHAIDIPWSASQQTTPPHRCKRMRVWELADRKRIARRRLRLLPLQPWNLLQVRGSVRADGTRQDTRAQTLWHTSAHIRAVCARTHIRAVSLTHSISLSLSSSLILSFFSSLTPFLSHSQLPLIYFSLALSFSLFVCLALSFSPRFSPPVPPFTVLYLFYQSFSFQIVVRIHDKKVTVLEVKPRGFTIKKSCGFTIKKVTV